jgi:transcriptional regulator with XRE-family HTH domain
MHWIQTIREHLELSQEEFARYLRLSPYMIQSVELGRRQLPVVSMRAALAVYNVIKNLQVHGTTNDHSSAADHHLRNVKRFHGQCCRKLDQCAHKLEAMQKSYASACFRHGVYQLLAQSLTPARSEDDLARLQWIQWKITETTQQVKDNNITAQDLLTAEIAGLKSVVDVLEDTHFSLRGAK